MVVGIGMDIVEIRRIEDAADRFGDRFLRRVFTADERSACASKKHPAESYAARFAAKEAAFKALGSGWDAAGGFTAVEVVTGEGGRPGLVFHGDARDRAERLGVNRVHLSMTHDAGISAAVVVLESFVERISCHP